MKSKQPNVCTFDPDWFMSRREFRGPRINVKRTHFTKLRGKVWRAWYLLSEALR